jgi:hypothetical protein
MYFNDELALSTELDVTDVKSKRCSIYAGASVIFSRVQFMALLVDRGYGQT